MLALTAVLASVVSPVDPAEQDLRQMRKAPSVEHRLGTDQLGRDMLSRLIHGSRISITVGVLSIGVAAVIGVPLGLAAGYYGGRFDRAIVWTMDILLSFPRVLLAILIVAVLGPGLINMMMAVGLWTVPMFARIVRSSALIVTRTDYVTAARALGARPLRILWQHLLPNCMGPLLVTATLSIGTAILTESSLSFLGLGIQPGTPSWGMMMSEGREVMRIAPHIITFPGIAIMLTVLAFNFVGDGLREALDPKQRR